MSEWRAEEKVSERRAAGEQGCERRERDYEREAAESDEREAPWSVRREVW